MRGAEAYLLMRNSTLVTGSFSVAGLGYGLGCDGIGAGLVEFGSVR